MAVDEVLKGPVLVATDLGPLADEAIRRADALAARGDAPLHACHILPEALRARVLFPHLHEREAADLLELERQAAARISERLMQLTGRESAQLSVHVDTGSPHSGILRQAERVSAGLIVVGAGKTAAPVVRAAQVPVLVVRPSTSGKVLGATDFSDPSLPALAAAAQEAQRRHVPLALIHAVNAPASAIGVGLVGIPLPVVTPAAMEEVRRSVRDQLEEFAKRAGVEAECLVKDGPAASAILDAARELPAELIVVGTHGRTGLSRLALGSVAEAVLEGAACSVLVVRVAS
jgi:nucleotide-binding universal stress UspA family protein